VIAVVFMESRTIDCLGDEESRGKEGEGKERRTSVSDIDIKMDNMIARKGELPDDLACFLQQQKQRQARMETTMRSFPSSMDVEMDKQDMVMKRKRNAHEDPMSHRIIEKRRRDRMNNCLADLSRLIPSSYLKKGRGRIEKTEIIEMAIKHMKHLQNHPCSKTDGCDLQHEIDQGLSRTTSVESFRVGYHECLTESMHFLVEKQGFYSGDAFCVRLMGHLQKHFDKLGKKSTSEIHSGVGETWTDMGLPSLNKGSNAEGRTKDRDGGRSEFGTVSEESGYSSHKAEEEAVDLTREEHDQGSVQEGGSMYSPDREERVRWDERASDLTMSREEMEQQEESGSSRYKFKSNIKHRFDMGVEEDMVEYKEKRRKTMDEREKVPALPDHMKQYEPHRGVHPLPESHIKLSPSPGPSFLQPGPSYPLPKPTGQLVPIFALNAKGSYYIPLSIDLAMVGPFLHLLTEEQPGPLHPININVNVNCKGAGEQGMAKREEERDWRTRGQGVIQQPSVIKHWREPVN